MTQDQRHCINGKDCDADEEQQRELQNESHVGVQKVQWKGDSGTQADKRLEGAGTSHTPLWKSLDVFPRLQQVMDQIRGGREDKLPTRQWQARQQSARNQ